MCIMTVFNHIIKSVYHSWDPSSSSMWFPPGWHSQSAMTTELPWEWGIINAAPLYRQESREKTLSHRCYMDAEVLGEIQGFQGVSPAVPSACRHWELK